MKRQRQTGDGVFRDDLGFEVGVYLPGLLVVFPEYLGDVIGQLNARRANIVGMDVRQGNSKSVRGQIPLSEMFGYATELRSATQGRGVFTMEFDHYAPVSEAVAQKVLRQ